jgi:hypothetical protein
MAFVNGFAQTYMRASDLGMRSRTRFQRLRETIILAKNCLYGQFRVSPKFLERAVLCRRDRDTHSVPLCPARTPVARL